MRIGYKKLNLTTLLKTNIYIGIIPQMKPEKSILANIFQTIVNIFISCSSQGVRILDGILLSSVQSIYNYL